MNFFEQELRKIVEPIDPGATYVGRACFVRLNEMNRAKLQFVTSGIADQYDAVQATILNRQDGTVDALRFRFHELFECAGKSRTFHPSFTQYGDGKYEWHLYQPTAKDYETLTGAVKEYLSVFQEMAQETSQSMTQQTM